VNIRHRLLAAPSTRLRLIAALLAGAVMPLGFAPLGWWPLTLFSLGVLMLLLTRGDDQSTVSVTPRQGLWIGYVFGIGQFGVGVGWVYESFTLFGATIAPIAGLITALFVLTLAWYPAVTCWAAVRVAGGSSRTALLFAFVASWTLFEWIRGWLFTGFPWLDLGVAQITGPLAGYLPLVGEYGTGLIALLLLLLVVRAWQQWLQGRLLRPAIVSVVAVVVVMTAGWALDRVQWTQPEGRPIRVGIAQGNVPQMQKFDPAVLVATLRNYLQLTDRLTDGHQLDLVVWPETAIPDFFNDLKWFHKILDERAAKGHFDMLVGVFTENAQKNRYHNALQGIPASVGRYEKRHLVPFGEYMPFRHIVDLFSGLIDIPMSDLSPGPEHQPLPVVKGNPVGASICYEAAIAREIRKSLPRARLFVNASNDSWFGDSFAPYQHLQMGQVRSLEFGRPMIRATNTGVSAFIDAKGHLRKAIPLDRRGVLSGKIQPRVGVTPYYWLGPWPAVIFSLLVFAILVLKRRWVPGPRQNGPGR